VALLSFVKYEGMRTIFVRVLSEATRSYAPVIAQPITSTTFIITGVPPEFIDDDLEFGVGDKVRGKRLGLRGPHEPTARSRMIAVERVP
jgi:hypothetical protein